MSHPFSCRWHQRVRHLAAAAMAPWPSRPCRARPAEGANVRGYTGPRGACLGCQILPTVHVHVAHVFDQVCRCQVKTRGQPGNAPLTQPSYDPIPTSPPRTLHFHELRSATALVFDSAHQQPPSVRSGSPVCKGAGSPPLTTLVADAAERRSEKQIWPGRSNR